MENNKNFIYGVAQLLLGSIDLGWIEKGSFDWGGKKGESVDIEAEQVPDAPVLVITQSNGTIAPTFNLIKLTYENFQKVLGGSLEGKEGAYTGWNAPTSLVDITGKITIKFVSGRKVEIPNAKLSANLGGKLALTEVSKLECELKVMKPEDGTSAPYSISDVTEENTQQEASTQQDA
jgi:hypothetical protein